MTFYKTTAVNINDLTSFFAKKMGLEEDGLEFNLQTGELFFVDKTGSKELIIIIKIANELPGLVGFNQEEYKKELEKQSLSTLRMVLDSRIESMNRDISKLNIVNQVLQDKLRVKESEEGK